jgi:ribokinase
MVQWAAKALRGAEGEISCVDKRTVNSVHEIIRKEPKWAREIFGPEAQWIMTNLTGYNVRDGIKRCTMNTDFLPPSQLVVYVDGSPVKDPRVLDEVESELEHLLPRRNLPRDERRATARPTRYALGDAFEEILDRLERMRRRRIDLFAVTAHNLDEFHTVDQIKSEHESTITTSMRQPGGSGANTAYGLAKLGCHVAVAGIVGQDVAGTRLKKDLEEVGVKVDNLLGSDGGPAFRTGRTLVLVDTSGRRMICVQPGINEQWSEAVEQRGAFENLVRAIAESKIVHLSSFTKRGERELQSRLVAALPGQTILSFTPGALYARLGLEELEPILARTNVIFLYENQLELLLENTPLGLTHPPRGSSRNENVKALFEWRRGKGHVQPIVVVIKPRQERVEPGLSHPEETMLATGKEALETLIPADVTADFYEPGKVPIDTTGAGDALAAGVLFGMLQGCGISRCALLGFEMAMRASTAIGARSGLPALDELQSANGIRLEDKRPTHRS